MHYPLFLVGYFFHWVLESKGKLVNSELCVKDDEGTMIFLDSIFLQYGSSTNDFSFLSRVELKQLMKRLSLGMVAIINNGTSNRHCQHYVSMDLMYRRASNLLSDQANDKNPNGEGNIKSSQHNSSILGRECLPTDQLLLLHGLNNSNKITKEDFIRICPAFVQQISSNACTAYNQKPKHKPMLTSSRVWGYSFIAITVISLLSLSVILVIPCIKKSFYNVLMGYLVALAVGTLSGDALLHLIPHAFIEGANTATKISLTKDEKVKQHYSQIWRALFVLLGIYIFFIVDQLMKLKEKFGLGRHCHNHGNDKDEYGLLDSEDSSSIVNLSPYTKMEGGPALSDHANTSQSLPSISEEHSISKEEKQSVTKESKIANVAWMVIVGDGFHNLSDGLAVGAAFSSSLSSGISTAIAVFCHELPHELGDFAILIKSGMGIKQAIAYNLISSLFAYAGMAIGILAGGNELCRHFILSITAGLFLYISLTNMLPELRNQEISGESPCTAYLCQHLGLLSGIAIMLVISLYERIL